MARRTLLFAFAVVVALLATISLYAYVTGVNDRAVADAKPVEVLVAKKLIPAGTAAQDASEKGLLTLSTVPRRSVPEGALSDIAPVSSLVALSDIYPGEMLLRAKFSDRQTTGALTIPPNKLAISVELGDPQRVAGFVVPGSQVAIFDTYDAAPTGGAPAGGAAAGGAAAGALQTTRLLLTKVQVIAVGPTTLRPSTNAKGAKAGTETPVPSTVLTVALTTREAEKLVHAAQTGKLYFGLMSATATSDAASQGVDNRNLFG